MTPQAAAVATRPVLVNRSYLPQRVTGQQRYAAEIVRRLLDSRGFDPVQPGPFWAASRARTHAWVQLVLPLRSRGQVLLSLTARAPMWRRRHVLVVHDLFVLTNPEWYSRGYVRTHAPLLRAQLRSAAAVVAVSEPVARQVRPYVHGPVAVAPNAPSDFFAEPDDGETTLADWGLEPGGYLLAVGSRDPRKNLPTLAAAYGRLTAEERRRTPLVVVGGEAAIFGRQQIDWPEGTIVTGYVDDGELRRFYRGARAVVFLSLAEGFGLPLVEAAAAGAPSLLVSDIEVFRWICGPHARYVAPDDPEAVVAGLRAQITDPVPLVMDLGRFTWDASARAVAELCREVAGRD